MKYEKGNRREINLSDRNIMIHKTKFTVITFLLMTLTCSSQKNKLDFDLCMKKRLEGIGIDFYKKMYDAEEKLIQLGGLSSNDKKSYIEAFKTLLTQEDKKWKKYQTELKKNVLSDLDIQLFELSLLSICSEINITNLDNTRNWTNVQKFFLKKLIFKKYDDDEVIDGLLLFTDFDNKIHRLNITYVLLLNMKEKYGN